jgi:enoyl-CoA hydratase/carnithine racemase
MPHIETHRHGDIVELRLARPPVNALSPDLLDELVMAVKAAPLQGAHGLVLSGGAKAFSGGLDVPLLLGLDRNGLKAAWGSFFAAARALAESPVPVVAAITGHSPAGGCVLALCCDYRIMARGPFRIGLNETQVGLAVPEAIQHLMRRVVGPHRAERLLVAGAMVESEQALAIGLVDELTDADGVVTRALAWHAALAPLPRTPLLATRAIARADVIEALRAFDEAEMERFIGGWYLPETQATLQALVARLKK